MGGLKGPPSPQRPPTCARATPHVNVDSWKKVRHLPPFGVPDGVNKALYPSRGVALAQVKNRVFQGVSHIRALFGHFDFD